MMSRLLGSLGFVTLVVSLQSAPADLVLIDGQILTVDARFRQATALADRDGRFVAVGSN
jgi:hypothetical protein